MEEKKTCLTTYQGLKEDNLKLKWQKNLLEDLPGGGRRKLRVKMAVKPTGGLIKGEKRKIISKNGKKNTPQKNFDKGEKYWQKTYSLT